jgi:SAM-dependent methyltransferase
MLLSRTRHKIKLALKGVVFDQFNFQEVINSRRQEALEKSMGFRGQWHEHSRFQLAFLRSHGLKPTDSLLEIGCGPLTGGIPLITYLQEGKYVGIDIRSSVLDLAWGEVALAKLSGKNPRLICSSSFGLEQLGERRFDCLFSFSVLYHLSDRLLHLYFSEVARRLNKSGACFAQVNTHLKNSTWLEFPFIRRDVDAYRDVARSYGLKTESLGTIESLGFRLFGQERLNEMLAFRSSSAT